MENYSGIELKAKTDLYNSLRRLKVVDYYHCEGCYVDISVEFDAKDNQSQFGDDFLQDYPLFRFPADSVHPYAPLVELVTSGYIYSTKYLIMLEDFTIIEIANSLRNKEISPPMRINDEFVPNGVGIFRYIELRICNMTNDEIFRIIKKYCEDNPEETSNSFINIVPLALIDLDRKEDCE